LKYFFIRKPYIKPNPRSEKKMSIRKSNQSVKGSKKFCKVCFDAGKTEAEYVSHYVRDSIGGAVVCPTILNQQCNYCKKQGHTPSHCPELEGKYKKQVQAKPVQAKPVQTKPVQTKPVQTKPVQTKPVQAKQQTQIQARATRLCESPPPFEDKINENFPLLGQVDSGKIVRPVPVKFNVWASIAAKPPSMKAPIVEAPIVVEAPIEEIQIILEDVEETIIIEAPIEEAPIEEEPIESPYIPTPVMSWSDM
jgi:hypothetical protein